MLRLTAIRNRRPRMAVRQSRAMGHDDRFEELAASVGGFYRSWVIYLGLELGLFARIRAAGAAGLTAAELAAAAGCRPEPIEAWLRAAHAGDLVDLRDGRATVADDVAAVLLDDTHPEYLGGQFVVGGRVEPRLRRAGRLLPDGPDRSPSGRRASTARSRRSPSRTSRSSSRRVSPSCPTWPPRSSRGGRVLDVACGGGKWLIAIARRFPETELVGVEFEPDSVERATEPRPRRGSRRSDPDRGRTDPRDMPFRAEFDLVYLQDALHELPDPTALAPRGVGGRRPGRPARRPRVVPARTTGRVARRSRPSSSGGSRSTSSTRAPGCTPMPGTRISSRRRMSRRRSSSTSGRARRCSSTRKAGA